MSPLWGKTDELASVPTWLKDKATGALKIARQSLPADARIIFVSIEEAQTPEAKANGLAIPGWYSYLEYETGGVTRRRVELLVEASVSAAEAGDTGIDAGEGAVVDDDILSGVALFFATQPVSASILVGENLDFGGEVASDVEGAVVTYQWEEKLETGVWEEVDGETTDTLTIAAVDHFDVNRTFRLVASSVTASNSPIYSNEVSITNVQALIEIDTDVVDFEYVDDSTDATFTIAASISDASDLTYQWFEVDAEDVLLDGETADTLTLDIAVADVGRSFYCVVSGSDAAPVTSATGEIVNLV